MHPPSRLRGAVCAIRTTHKLDNGQRLFGRPTWIGWRQDAFAADATGRSQKMRRKAVKHLGPVIN